MRITGYLVVTILVIVTMSTCAVFATTESTPPEGENAAFDPNVVATVNGEPIRVKDLEVRLGSLHGEAREGARSEFKVDRLVDRLINDTLLAQEARALEMQNEPPTDDQVRRFEDGVLLTLLARDEFEVASRASDVEIAARYEKLYRRVTLRVLTTLEQDEAEAALARVRAGEDLVELVGELSVDPYRAREGLVDGITRMKVQREIGEIAFRSEPGDLGGPVQTNLGYSIFRVESFQDADPAAFEGVRGTVAALIQHEKKQALQEAFGRQVRDTIPVHIDQAQVDAIGVKRLEDGRLIQDVPDPTAILARIGENRTITADLYGLELLARLGGVRNEDAAVAMKPMILGTMIEEQLFLEEATRRGYDDRPDVVATVRRKENDLLAPRFLEEIVTADIEVTQDEMQAYYADNIDRFRRPPRVRIGQITTASRDEAERLVELLRDGADLPWLARKHSIDRFKDVGGDRGWETITPGADALGDWMLSARPGEVHDVIGTPGNWLVFVLTAKQDQGTYDYDEVSGNVRNKVFEEKVGETLHAYVTALRERSEIRINRDALDRLSVTGERSEATEQQEGPHGGHAH